jgi:hypothetical protein
LLNRIAGRGHVVLMNLERNDRDYEICSSETACSFCVGNFEQLIRDPNHPAKMRAEYDSGDHVHPGAAGYKAMADYVPLELLSGKKK